MKMTIAKSKKLTIAKKILAGILTLNVALFSAIPVYAVAENTEYENSLRSGWGSSTSNFQYPSAYNTSWNRQVINFIDLVATRTQNVYNRLGDISSTLINISTNTGYIQSISTHFNSTLHSGWGDSSSYFMVPSGMRGSWYGASLMLLDTIQQRLSEPLQFELDTSTQAILEDISTNSAIISENTYNTNNSVIALGDKLSRTFSRGYNFVGGRGSLGTSNLPTAQNGIVKNTSSPNTYIPFYTSTNNNSMQHTFADITNLTITDFIYLLTNNVTQFGSRIFTPYTIYQTKESDISDGISNNGYFAYSLSDIIYALQTQSSDFYSRMGFVLADDDTIIAKNANKTQEQSALTNFTGQGNSSASASDFTQLSSAVTSVKSGLNSNASPTNVLGVFNSTDGFGWFSQATLDTLDTTTQNTRRAKAIIDTPLYDSNYNAIMEYLTGGDKK